MSTGKRFVLRGPRAPASDDEAPSRDKQQIQTRSSGRKKTTPKKLEHEREETNSEKRSKSVTFDLTPQVKIFEQRVTRKPEPGDFSAGKLLHMSGAVKSKSPSGSNVMKDHDSLSDESDTIAVEQKTRVIDVSDDEAEEESPLSDLAHLEAKFDADHTHGPATDESHARKDEDAEMSDTAEVEEDVDEGHVDYGEHITPEPDFDDAGSVISVSSTEEDKGYADHPAGIFGVPNRPWKSNSWKPETRFAWETMYCNPPDKPVGNGWADTEDYMLKKDRELMKYVEDFPIAKWVIPKKKAEQAWYRLLERNRWRELGIPIYGHQQVIPNAPPGMQAVPSSSLAPVQQPPMAGHPSGYYPQMHHNSAPAYHHYQSMHHPPQGFPPQQQMMQHGPGNMLNHQVPHQHLQHYPHPHMVGQTMGQMPPGMPYMTTNTTLPYHPQQQGYNAPMRAPPAASSNARSSKPKKDTPPAMEPEGPPPTPPYPALERPSDKNKTNKSGKRNNRRQAEAREYPWHRNIDFKKERDEAKWDMSEYDPAVLNSMAATREQNGPYIREQDEILNVKQRKQRESRLARKKGFKKASSEAGAADSEDDGAETKTGTPGAKRKKNENVGGDPYHQGEYCFASQTDVQKGLVLGKTSPNDILTAAEEGDVHWDLCKEIYVTWNASKKGQTEQLVQGRFRIYDVLITRQQMLVTLVLTRKAAECIVDFCPDMLWRETLLRMASEAGFGNKDIRDRFCYNGCWADKATFTKRIAGALGQKQNNATRAKKNDGDENVVEDEDLPMTLKKRGRASTIPKDVKDRYGDGEYEWYQQNDRDYNAYIAFFGKRTGHRNLSHVLRADKKRKVDDDSVEPGPSIKRTKSETTDEQAPAARGEGSDAMDVDKAVTDGEETEEEEDKDDDAVSMQDSDILDDLSD